MSQKIYPKQLLFCVLETDFTLTGQFYQSYIYLLDYHFLPDNVKDSISTNFLVWLNQTLKLND